MNILHLEDSAADADQVIAALARAGIDARYTRVWEEHAFVEALSNGAIALILGDYNLPAYDGLSALAVAREKRPDVPFIFVSGIIPEEIAIEAMKSGATDYVFKSRLERLAPVVRRALEEARTRRDRLDYEQALYKLTAASRAVAGPGFLRALVRVLAEVLGTRYAFIGLVADPGVTRVRTIALWSGDGFAENFEYSLAGTPCENVAGKTECFYPSGVQERFPNDRLLADMRVESYHGVPLMRRDGAPLGLLSAFDVRPMDTRTHLRPLLREFAERAAAELARLEAEEKLNASNEQLKLLVESSPLAIYARDRNGFLTSWNPAAETMFGWKAAEVLRKPLPSVPDEERAQSDALRLRVLAGEPFIRNESRRRRKDGSAIDIDAYLGPLRAASGEVVGVIAVVADVTARKQAEMARRESERRLAIMMDQLPGMAYRCRHDADLTLEFASKGCEKLTGYPPADFVGNARLSFADIILAEDRQAVFAAVGRALAEKAPFVLEYRIRTANGAIRTVWEQGSGVYGADGGTVAVEGLIIDITERKVAEEALRAQADQLRRLSRRLIEVEESERRRLARELHDLVGQNVVAMNLSLGMIRAGLRADDREQVSAHLEDCEAVLQSTGDLVRDVMADLRPPGLDELGLLAALNGYARQAGGRGGVRITVSGAEITPRLPAAAEIALFRVAQEAIVNVLKHARATNVAVTLESRPGRTIMMIADNGCGFDPAVQRFQGTSHLGLVNMRERADSIGGELRVESALGRGTRVIVEAPRVAPASSDQPHLPGLEPA